MGMTRPTFRTVMSDFVLCRQNSRVVHLMTVGHSYPELFYYPRSSLSKTIYTNEYLSMCTIEIPQLAKKVAPSAGESSQNSHQKSPKSPDGGISPITLGETCRASNSVWKIGITRFIRITQSKVRSIENLPFLMISAIFEMLLLWTA